MTKERTRRCMAREEAYMKTMGGLIFAWMTKRIYISNDSSRMALDSDKGFRKEASTAWA